MKKVIICLGQISDLPVIDADVVGVDYGAQFLADNKVPMVLAVGDFDSTDKLDLIKGYCKEVRVLTSQKNETDSEVAFEWAAKYYDCIDVYGGLGGRLDHEYANLSLLINRKYPITFYNNKNKVFALSSGTHTIGKNDYRYISFFPIVDSVISLSRVKYPLEKAELKIGDIYTVSNEIISETMVLEVIGEVLVIQSNDKENKKG